MKHKNLVGIDLGTTYSSLARLDSILRPQPVANAEGDFATPSVVYLPKNRGNSAVGKDAVEPIVGRDAIEPGICHPKRFIANAKRHLGEPCAWEIGNRSYTPVDVSALILRKLIEDAIPQIGEIEEAVITVPAHFNSYQRQLTIEAGRQAGLKGVAIVNEPVAAALSYAFEDESVHTTHVLDDFSVLVYDLGGGTFDLSLVRYDNEHLDLLGADDYEQRLIRVLASSGEQHLGGIDWDQCLVDEIVDSFRMIHGIDLHEDEQFVRRLARKVESAKRALSNPKIDKTNLLVQHNGLEEEFVLGRKVFEELTSHLVEQTRVLTEQLLDTAGMSWQELDRVIPVGGSTRMPMIRNLLETLASQRTVICKISPDLSVAQGAAIYAGMLHLRAKGSTGVPIQIVAPTSLGVILRRNDGRRMNHILIPKNSPLPVSAKVSVKTCWANQTKIDVKIIEGETDSVDACRMVCHCTVDQLPKGLRKGSVFDVEVTYNDEGLLEVSVKHRESGRLASVSTFRTSDANGG